MAADNIPSLSRRLEIETYEIEGGLVVFTERFHIRRGFCCGSDCRHCPYSPKAQKGNTRLQDGFKPIGTVEV